MQAQLVPLDGTEPIVLTRDLTLVGRREDCDLQLHHKSVSKIHCVLVKTDGVLLLRDLGSTNGTRVNGTRVRRAVLLANEELTIANLRFRVALGPAALALPRPANEHTQRLESRDVARLLRAPAAPNPSESSIELPSLPVQTNALPDVYPEEQGSGAR